MADQPVLIYWTDRHSQLRQLETRIGVVAATLSAIASSCGDLVYVRSNNNDVPMPVQRIMLALVAISVLSQWMFVAFAWCCIRGSEIGFGPSLVAVQPRLPIILRPIVALIWLLQFAMGVVYTLGMEHAIDVTVPVPGQFWYIGVLLALVGGYASFLYLMLAIGTILPRTNLMQAMWKCRFAFDIAIVILARCLASLR